MAGLVVVAGIIGDGGEQGGASRQGAKGSGRLYLIAGFARLAAGVRLGDACEVDGPALRGVGGRTSSRWEWRLGVWMWGVV